MLRANAAISAGVAIPPYGDRRHSRSTKPWAPFGGTTYRRLFSAKCSFHVAKAANGTHASDPSSCNS